MEQTQNGLHRAREWPGEIPCMDTGFPHPVPVQDISCPEKQHPARNILPTALLVELHPVHLTPAQSPLGRPSPLPMPTEDSFSGRRCYLSVGSLHRLPVPL